jgi:radical SAM enzyme (TIGR01210 family)
VHPAVLPRLNKKFDLDHFASAAELLRREGIAVRTFVLVKPPFLDDAEAIEWAVKSAAFAFDCGAGVVSLIPTRGGNGAMERLSEAGDFTPPQLSVLERTLEQVLCLKRGRVFADTWDLETFSGCAACLEMRRQRLCAMNLFQATLPAIHCQVCEVA